MVCYIAIMINIPSYSPFDIGLFGLLGVIGALLAPMWGRLVDRIVPWSGQFIGACLCLISMVVATAAASISIGGVVIPMVLFDCGAQLYNISNSYRVAGIDPKARARLNGCVLFCMFIGQVSAFFMSRVSCMIADHVDCGNSHPDEDLQRAWMASDRRDRSGIHRCTPHSSPG